MFESLLDDLTFQDQVRKRSGEEDPDRYNCCGTGAGPENNRNCTGNYRNPGSALSTTESRVLEGLAAEPKRRVHNCYTE